MARAYNSSNTSAGSYGSLLNAFSDTQGHIRPAKRRKFNSAKSDTLKNSKSDADPASNDGLSLDPERTSHGSEARKEAVEEDSAEGEDEDFREDPFQHHYVSIDEAILKRAAKGTVTGPTQTATIELDEDVRRTKFTGVKSEEVFHAPKQIDAFYFKERLKSVASQIFHVLTPSEKDIFGALSTYLDVLTGLRSPRNAKSLEDICILHSLNHIFKTRDRVIKNNQKLSQKQDEEAVEARDQGFTRPKVLILAPTKQACVRLVESIVRICQPDQQENKSRFLDRFSREDPDEWSEKPEDFRELFGGNHEEDFRIGLKFTRKTLKYFSKFYDSDIIIASPLGLMRTITNGEKQEEERKHDSDFLSSIEIAIVDHATALQMQNWQHVEFVLSQLNLMPKDSHGCDFSRVRHWYLDGHAKLLRQTIILSAFLTPEVYSLAAEHLHNVAGRVRYLPTYSGAMTEVANALPFSVHQTFVRFQAPTAERETTARFQLFTSTVLPQIVREGEASQGCLIFIPTYLEFLELRNHFSNASESILLNHGAISEYTTVKEVNRTRSHFMNGRHNILLYSERAHHHFRYRLRGVRKVVFYGIPENPLFWVEIIALLGMSDRLLEGNSEGKGLVRALFSKWDAMKLERVVGTERVSRLLSERSGDTFDFV